MGKLKSKDFYQDFHVTIHKNNKVNGIPPVTLKDMGLPYDLDYPEQTINELSKEQLDNLVEEFIFLIDELLPRDIQDLFYKATLEPRRAYWKLFEMAARKMQLSCYLNIHRDTATDYYNITDGIIGFYQEGRTIADIYKNTCITKTMLLDVLDSHALLNGYIDAADREVQQLLPIELALFRISKYNYKRFVPVEECARDISLALYDDLGNLILAVSVFEFNDDDLDKDISVPADVLELEEYCVKKQIPFMKFSANEADTLYESRELTKLLGEAIDNLAFTLEYNENHDFIGFEDWTGDYFYF